jgi:hypothetical protein
MPDPFNKAKMTGDTHPPEVESDLPLEEGSTHAAGVKKAGLLKDDDAGTPSVETERQSGGGTGGDRG